MQGEPFNTSRLRFRKGSEYLNRKIQIRNICLLLLPLLLTSCTFPTPTLAPSATSAVVPSVTEMHQATQAPIASITPVSSNGGCTNDFYPVREGATWTYSSTGGPAGGNGFTDTITSVRADGFTLTSQFGDLIRTQEWACTPQGLVALQLGGTSAAILNEDNMQATLHVDNVSGVTFPAAINPGDTWQHTLEFTGKVTVAGQAIDAKGVAQSSFQAMEFESVTVPAGTFDALKIHVETTIDISGNFNGISFPVKVTTPYDYWFAQRVGWVKASGTGNVGDETFSETIELQTYHIP
jgi:hypothetical protein